MTLLTRCGCRKTIFSPAAETIVVPIFGRERSRYGRREFKWDGEYDLDGSRVYREV